MMKNVEAGEERAPQVYELGYHLVPTISESALEGEVARVKASLTESGAAIIAEEIPHLITLAYRIEKHLAGKIEKFSTAYFGWVKFEATSEGVRAAKKALDENASVLRFLLVHTVRESTLAPRRFAVPAVREGEAPARAPRREVRKPVATVAAPAAVSDAELDRTIDALVK